MPNRRAAAVMVFLVKTSECFPIALFGDILCTRTWWQEPQMVWSFPFGVRNFLLIFSSMRPLVYMPDTFLTRKGEKTKLFPSTIYINFYYLFAVLRVGLFVRYLSCYSPSLSPCHSLLLPLVDISLFITSPIKFFFSSSFLAHFGVLRLWGSEKLPLLPGVLFGCLCLSYYSVVEMICWTFGLLRFLSLLTHCHLILILYAVGNGNGCFDFQLSFVCCCWLFFSHRKVAENKMMDFSIFAIYSLGFASLHFIFIFILRFALVNVA